jgi:hypothetical protein
VVEKPKPSFFALSVRQPWAYLIVMGQKTIELRTWSTRYRGLLLIHAAKKIDDPAINCLGLQNSGLETGCLVGAVELVDVIKMAPDTLRRRQREHRSYGPFSRDMYGFVLEAPQVFSEPIPISGSLGIFNVTGPGAAAVRKQLRAG